jgi:AcrR family transcriptional regulator
MVRSSPPRPRKKPADRYHHGDLRRALLDEALRTIQAHGVRYLTLRTVGGRLGVSRSALYRHFADKQVQFAVAHPSHYRVIFGGFIESATKDENFIREARAAFQVLVDALVDQQNAGLIRRDDPALMTRFVWAVVHGISMLVIDGQLREADQRELLEHYAIERLRGTLTAVV